MSPLLLSPSQIVNPLARQRFMGFGTGSGGSGIPPLPAGATARWSTQNLVGSDGDLIATLEDLIGTNDGTAAGSARPTLKTGANGLNGNPVLRFDGVNNVLSLASSIAGVNSYTVVAVLKRTGTEMITLANTANYFPSVFRTVDNLVYSDALEIGNAPSAGTGWEVLVMGRNGGAGFASRNGVSITPEADSPYATVNLFTHIGARLSSFANGDLADLIYYPSLLDPANCAAAAASVNATWGGVY